MANTNFGSENTIFGALIYKTALGSHPQTLESVCSTFACILIRRFSPAEIIPNFDFHENDKPSLEEIEARIKKYTKLYLSIGQFSLNHRFGPELLEAIVQRSISQNDVTCPFERRQFLKSLVQRFTFMLGSPSAIEEARRYFKFNGSGRLDFQNNLVNLLESTLSSVYLAMAV